MADRRLLRPHHRSHARLAPVAGARIEVARLAGARAEPVREVRYIAPPGAPWLHYLHGTVPGRGNDWICRPRGQPGGVSPRHVQQLLDLILVHDVADPDEVTLTFANLSLKDPTWRLGRGGMGVVAHFRVPASVDTNGTPPRFVHALLSLDQPIEVVSLGAVAGALLQTTLADRGAPDRPVDWWYARYRAVAEHGDAAALEVLESYLAEFPPLPSGRGKAGSQRWEPAEGAAWPREVRVRCGARTPETWRDALDAMVALAAFLYWTRLPWAAVTTGAGRAGDDGLVIRFLFGPPVPEEEEIALSSLPREPVALACALLPLAAREVSTLELHAVVEDAGVELGPGPEDRVEKVDAVAEPDPTPLLGWLPPPPMTVVAEVEPEDMDLATEPEPEPPPSPPALEMPGERAALAPSSEVAGPAIAFEPLSAVEAPRAAAVFTAPPLTEAPTPVPPEPARARGRPLPLWLTWLTILVGSVVVAVVVAFTLLAIWPARVERELPEARAPEASTPTPEPAALAPEPAPTPEPAVPPPEPSAQPASPAHTTAKVVAPKKPGAKAPSAGGAPATAGAARAPAGTVVLLGDALKVTLGQHELNPGSNQIAPGRYTMRARFVGSGVMAFGAVDVAKGKTARVRCVAATQTCSVEE